MIDKEELDRCIKHLRDRDYLSLIQRDENRIQKNGEIFTPTELVREVLDHLPQEYFADPTKTYLDNCCGDGQFLSEVVIRKLDNGLTLEQALRTTYGVELMMDNVMLCRERLLCGHEEYRHIVTTNIVCHDALKYDYEFNGTDYTNEELAAKNKYDFPWM